MESNKEQKNTNGRPYSQTGRITENNYGKLIQQENPKGTPCLPEVEQIIEDTGSRNYEEMKIKASDRLEQITATNQSVD